MEKKNCFVIMPVSGTTIEHTEEYWRDFYDNNIKSIVENHSNAGISYTCDRLEGSYGNIIGDLVKKIIESDVVIAVLTDYNKNVLYELGMRHIVKEGTLMLLEAKQNQRIKDILPSDLQSYWVARYQGNNIGDLKKKISNFLKNCGNDTHKSFMPYQILYEYTIPADAYIKSGFKGITIPQHLVSKKTKCNLLVINLHDEMFSASIDSFFEETDGEINILYTTNGYTQLTRALSIGRTVDEYLKKSGPESKDFIENFLNVESAKRRKRNVKIYDTYPFGLYLQVDKIIWFIPLWNKSKDKTKSAYANSCIQISSESTFGKMLENNFYFLWNEAKPYESKPDNK